MPDPSDIRLLRAVSTACLEQADALQEVLARLLETPPSAGSAAARDEQAVLRMVGSRARQELWADCLLSVLHLGVHVGDHLRSLGLLLSHVGEQSAPVYAHAALARGAVESAAWLRWLLAVGEPVQTRMGRGIALLIEDTAKAAHAAGQLPLRAYLESPSVVEDRRARQLLDRLAAARIDTVRNNSGTAIKAVRIGSGGPEVPVSAKITPLVEDAFGDLPAVYALLSGVVHARPWGLSDNAHVQGRTASWKANPIMVSNSALICLLAAHRSAAVFAEYRGFPDDGIVQAMLARHTAANRRLVRFGHDEGYLDGLAPVAGFVGRR